MLWKKAKQGEPAETNWQSPWGAGRPGWHIECSAMSTCCLGESFDIHGGGFDLQFPHHENEIAQSEGATGKSYANYWLHVGFVNVDGEKMSKSLGNFFTIKDVMAQFHPETIRFFILSSHYKSPINFSDTALKEAHSGLSRLYHALKNTNAKTDEAMWANEFGQAFMRAMNDDFNTPKAMSVLFEVAGLLNRAKKDDPSQVPMLACTLKTLSGVLNIASLEPEAFLQAVIGGDGGLSDDEIVSKIKARADAKSTKDFALADAIRDELKAQGIELEDSRDGTTWRRV